MKFNHARLLDRVTFFKRLVLLSQTHAPEWKPASTSEFYRRRVENTRFVGEGPYRVLPVGSAWCTVLLDLRFKLSQSKLQT